MHLLAHIEAYSRETPFIPQLLQSLSSNESALSSGERLTQSRVKDKSELLDTQSTVALHSVPRGQGSKALLREANRELKAAKASTYSHKTQVNEALGQFNYDCSGFLKYAIARSVPEALRSLQTATVRRPLAKHFVGFVTSLPSGKVVGRWKRIERATDLAPGDIIAWLKPPTVVSDNTGHVMIVRAAIRQHPKRSNEIIIPIIDSTATRHGHSDSRHKAAETGLGTGSIVLVVDDSGKAIGYRWSRSENSRRHTTKIALTRLE
ncbi:hypothetical protein [Trichocoleus sp. FACHB-262]|uniref:hypothetical protein n=1 Tax=Trichocoleus sp. FACHB-262 TaxID=2692869 RepID=UPI0019A7C57E|nr:hypothetical protein [Trichocoleus sp. FACHB-262]MBD2120983.1 hypothetical protein [Trichocoleus sp. FACHB-262]